MKAGDDPGPVAGVILYMLAGPLIWAAHLFLVYGPQSALCAFRVTGVAQVDVWLVSAFTAVVSLLAVVPLIWLLWRPKESARLFRADAFLDDDNAFQPVVMRVLAALSLAGVIWVGAAVLMLDACAQLR